MPDDAAARAFHAAALFYNLHRRPRRGDIHFSWYLASSGRRGRNEPGGCWPVIPCLQVGRHRAIETRFYV